MSKKEFFLRIEKLSLSERIALMEQILKSIRSELKSVKHRNMRRKKDDVHKRRQSFEIEPFDLGEEVIVDRDEMYSDRGI
ncbi:hypothetical protein GWO43_03340 [candidate division KSB1 bacterium]|nr:hypothetical protein [candidate division KSB1 bacterium]NIR71697.1 hypothetical protein [candidate division KSB1 bacterium]NIS23103.1 hypothetical protein [candidate division KSB1 bacterium]NIT69938.1 hypothetical protein [candidate division KSB1 bacterium]NIU26438.1 hypothetical protein [candidate division KSB1 bacterium]